MSGGPFHGADNETCKHLPCQLLYAPHRRNINFSKCLGPSVIGADPGRIISPLPSQRMHRKPPSFTLAMLIGGALKLILLVC